MNPRIVVALASVALWTATTAVMRLRPVRMWSAYKRGLRIRRFVDGFFPDGTPMEEVERLVNRHLVRSRRRSRLTTAEEIELRRGAGLWHTLEELQAR